MEHQFRLACFQIGLEFFDTGYAGIFHVLTQLFGKQDELGEVLAGYFQVDGWTHRRTKRRWIHRNLCAWNVFHAFTNVFHDATGAFAIPLFEGNEGNGDTSFMWRAAHADPFVGIRSAFAHLSEYSFHYIRIIGQDGLEFTFHLFGYRICFLYISSQWSRYEYVHISGVSFREINDLRRNDAQAGTTSEKQQHSAQKEPNWSVTFQRIADGAVIETFQSYQRTFLESDGSRGQHEAVQSSYECYYNRQVTQEGGFGQMRQHSDDQRTRHEVPEIPGRFFRSGTLFLHLHEACCDDRVDDQADEQR